MRAGTSTQYVPRLRTRQTGVVGGLNLLRLFGSLGRGSQQHVRRARIERERSDFLTSREGLRTSVGGPS